MLYQKNYMLNITDGPGRSDLAMAWSLAGIPTHEDHSIVEFTSAEGTIRPAVIRELAHTNHSNIIGLAGGIAWHLSEARPEILAQLETDPEADPLIMATFTGTYDLRGRSGLFTVEYYITDDQK